MSENLINRYQLSSTYRVMCRYGSP